MQFDINTRHWYTFIRTAIFEIAGTAVSLFKISCEKRTENLKYITLDDKVPVQNNRGCDQRKTDRVLSNPVISFFSAMHFKLQNRFHRFKEAKHDITVYYTRRRKTL